MHYLLKASVPGGGHSQNYTSVQPAAIHPFCGSLLPVTLPHSIAGNILNGQPLTLKHASQRIASLEERLDALESVMGLSDVEPSRLFGFTRTEQALFDLIRSRQGVVSRQAALTVLYGLRPDADQVDMRIIDAFICRVRRKLPSNITLRTEWGRGWYFDAEARRRLDLEAQSRAT